MIKLQFPLVENFVATSYKANIQILIFYVFFTFGEKEKEKHTINRKAKEGLNLVLN